MIDRLASEMNEEGDRIGKEYYAAGKARETNRVTCMGMAPAEELIRRRARRSAGRYLCTF